MSPRLRVLVAIASFGTKNDRYLLRAVEEYRSMSFDIDIVVVSNLHKQVPSGVEVVVVDLSGANPWTLPFAHKEILATRLNDYDLFVYSEDDTLITERNLVAFLEVSAALPENELVGFLRFEEGPDRKRHFPDVHDHFHWDPSSLRSRGNRKFAVFTNEHSACYVLTRQQLRRAVDSGGFLVRPHCEGKYLLLETAATDPYTQCGFKKLICISQIEDFLVHHLPDKYVGMAFGVSESELVRQVNALLQIANNVHAPASLFQTETNLRHASYSKNYYEPVRPDVVSAIPSCVQSVLSLGCGWGATEKWLSEKGIRVVAIPIDPVIPGGAKAGNIDIICADFQTARQKLASDRFDCLLVPNVLHLVPDPIDVLASFRSLLSDGGVAILVVPNVSRLVTYWRTISRNGSLKLFGGYGRTGVQLTSHRTVRHWLRSAGMVPVNIAHVLTAQARVAGRFTLGLTDRLLCSEFIAVARNCEAHSFRGQRIDGQA